MKSSLKHISSLQNEEIKKISSLKEKKARLETGLFVVEGRRSIETFIQAGWHPLKIFLAESIFKKEKDNLVTRTHALEFIDNIVNKISDFIPVLVKDNVMKKMSSQTSPSGYLAVFNLPEISKKFKKSPETTQGFKRLTEPLTKDFKKAEISKDKNLKPGVILFNITDPGNMGTLIRTAVALNSSCIIIEGCDPWSPKVIQSSAGNIANAEIFQFSWQEFLKLKGQSKISALVVSDGEKPSKENLSNHFLIVGNEAHGIPEDILKKCDYKITLPMPGLAESLNASIAGSIALYLAHNIKI